jgi:hypothetical protein
VEFQRNFGCYQDLALTEPVAVSRNGREHLVVLSADEYHRLKKRDRVVTVLPVVRPPSVNPVLAIETGNCEHPRECEYNRGTGCGKTARPGLWRGLRVTGVPTPECWMAGHCNSRAIEVGLPGPPTVVGPRYRICRDFLPTEVSGPNTEHRLAGRSRLGQDTALSTLSPGGSNRWRH